MSSLHLNRTGNLVHLICSFFFFFTIVTSNSVPVKLKEVEGTNETLNNETSTGEKSQGGNSLSPSPFANVIKSSHLENPLQVLEALRKDFEQIRSALEKTWPQSQSTDRNANSFTPPASDGTGGGGGEQSPPAPGLARSLFDGLSSIARRLPLVSQALTILLRSEAVSGSSSTSNGQLNDQRSAVETNGKNSALNSVNSDVSTPLESLDLLSKTFDSFHRTVQQLPLDPTARDEISKQEDIKLPLSPLHHRLQVHLQRMESIRNRLNEGVRNLLGRWVDTNAKLVLPNGEASNSAGGAGDVVSSKSQIGDPSPSISFDVNDKPFVLDQVKGSNSTSTDEDEKVASDFNTIRDAAAGVSIDTFKTFGSTVDTLRKTMAFLTQLYTKLLASYILQATSEQLHRSVLDRIGGTAANIGNRVTGTFSTQVRSWMGTNPSKHREQAAEPAGERINEVTSTSTSSASPFLPSSSSSSSFSKETVDGTTKNKGTQEPVKNRFDPFVSSPENPYGSLHPLGVLSRELNQIIDLASSISNLG